MSSFKNTIDVVGHDSLMESIIDRSITELKDDQIKTIGDYSLYSCKCLTLVDLPSLEAIGVAAFQCCSALDTLILRNESVPLSVDGSAIWASAIGVNWILGTAIASGKGYIYVPSVMVTKYSTHAYAKPYANQFRALEDYTVDGTVNGDLDESKI
jgi:hypothetical protein